MARVLAKTHAHVRVCTRALLAPFQLFNAMVYLPIKPMRAVETVRALDQTLAIAKMDTVVQIAANLHALKRSHLMHPFVPVMAPVLVRTIARVIQITLAQAAKKQYVSVSLRHQVQFATIAMALAYLQIIVPAQ